MIEDAELIKWVQARISQGRFRHSLGVHEVVQKLATEHGQDSGPLRRAAILHDCAREISAEETLSMAEMWNLEIRPVDRRRPVLLHGKLAVELVARELGLCEPSMVSAILAHTAGHQDMSTSDKIFYLADNIEPYRSYEGVEELREIAYKDVDVAILRAVEMSKAYLREMGGEIDPDTFQLEKALRLATH